MIQFSYSEFFLFLFLGPIVAAILFVLLMKVKNFVGYIIYRVQSNKIFKERYKKVEEMKAAGGFHEWVKIQVTPEKEVYVCKKTGFCAELHGFFEIKYIEAILEMRKEQEEYEKFKSEKLTNIAKTYGLKFDELDGLVNEVASVKKQFLAIKAEKMLKDLIEKAKSNEQV